MFGPSHFVDYDTSYCSRLTWFAEWDESDLTEYDGDIITPSFQLLPYGIGDIKVVTST